MVIFQIPVSAAEFGDRLSATPYLAAPARRRPLHRSRRAGLRKKGIGAVGLQPQRRPGGSSRSVARAPRARLDASARVNSATDWRDRPVVHAYGLADPPRPPPP